MLLPAVKSISDKADEDSVRGRELRLALSGTTNGLVVGFGKEHESASEATLCVACNSRIVPPGLFVRSAEVGRSRVGECIRIPFILISITWRPLKEGPGSCIPFAYL
jgi:hypothetical protein